MQDKKTNKIMATATVAMALGAAIDAISAFGNFEAKSKPEIGALIVLGLFALITASLAYTSWSQLKDLKKK